MSTSVVLMSLLVVADPGGVSPYRVDPLTDSLATGSMLGLLLLTEAAVKPSLPGGLACVPVAETNRCNSDDLNALDRAGLTRGNGAWRTTSDILGWSAVAIPLGVTVVDNMLSDSSIPWIDAASDGLVMTEAVAAAALATHVLKFAVRRPRPTQYVTGRSVSSVEHQLSFPSGHTSMVASAAAAYATTYWYRHDTILGRLLVMSLGVGITAVTGLARVRGGMHFYTDVIGGALVGGALGVLVPALHRVDPTLTVAVTGPGLTDHEATSVQLQWRL